MALQFSDLSFAAFIQPIWLSLQVAVIASVIAVVMGIWIGKLLARKQFRGKVFLETFLMIPMVLPPTVIGFLLLVLFGRNSIVGQAFEWFFGQSVVFTMPAAIIAATVVAFPLMYHAAKAGFSGVDESIEEAAKIDGASNWQVFLKVTLPLAKNSLIAGVILSFARALGEFGATFMFAGNIPGKTQTIPTAIYIALTSNQMALAWLWVGVMIVISFVLLFVIQLKNREIN